jgi:hypothetical protein
MVVLSSFHQLLCALVYYIITAIFYGAGMALIGWRVNRRFGLKRIGLFIIFFGFYVVFRDFTESAATQSSNLIMFGHGPVPMLADALAWVIFIATAQLVMRLLAGAVESVQLG